MRLHIFSDLHFDARPGGWSPKLAPGADAVLCAGDICQGLPEAFAYLRAFIPWPTPIITVAGNHSFYHRDHGREIERGRLAAREHGITFLEDDAAVIGGVRFLGATLWTDYALYGAAARVDAMRLAYRDMNDHRFIAVNGQHLSSFHPSHALDLHSDSVAFLRGAMAAPFDGPTVVLTHHIPHLGGVAEQYRGDLLNAAFASDLAWLIAEGRPAAWCFGHTHTSFDFTEGDTRLICNPHGYGRENAAGFDPGCVVEVLPGQPVRRLGREAPVCVP